MTYKITDEAKLKAVFPQFLKTKRVKTVTEVTVLDQAKVKLAIRAGIAVPGVEKVNE